ncbi:MAG: DegT/DnrJ/EryC1/StrS family aminotransferase [bacterium]|nr:DegT/DnrJ/EryC1/StrS family aminotransferase [bacterium]
MIKSELALLGGTPVLTKKLPGYNSIAIGREEEQAVLRVIRSKNLSGFLGLGAKEFWGGPFVRKFEKEFGRYFKIRYALSFNSATTALQAAVAALGIGPGDEVITSPFTMSATPASVLLNNAVPVFADIDLQTYCLSAESIEKRITKRTKAILAVNLFGGSADYGPILRLARKRHLKVIEDNAQAPGATYRGRFTGTIGDIGVFSFNVHKHIQSGEGGMLVTNNKSYAYRAALARNHGEVAADDWSGRGKFFRELIIGSNYRLTEIQAAILSAQLKKLQNLNQQRIILADYLTKRLKKFYWLAPVSVLPKSRHVYYLYPIKFFGKKLGLGRKIFAMALAAEGFELEEGYQKPLYLLRTYQKKQIYPRSRFPFIAREYQQKVDYRTGICPVAERMYREELFVTNLCQPPKTKKFIDLFVGALEKIERNVKALKTYERKRIRSSKA